MPAEPARPLPRPDSDAPDNHASPTPQRVPNQIRGLRRALRRELRRRDREQPSTVPMTVYGFADNQLVALPRVVTHAPESLLGLRVPDRFQAVAAIASSVMTTSRRTHADATLAVAVSRAGHEVCFLGREAEVVETWQPQGWLVDACRRSLGLPTQPSLAPPVDLSLALWLDYLLVALVEHRDITWDDAVAWCPVVGPRDLSDPELLGLRMADTVPSWSALRVAAAGGAALPVPVQADHAAWMDDAMFARWVLGFFPDVDDLRSDVEFLAPAELAEDVERVVRAARRSTND